MVNFAYVIAGSEATGGAGIQTDLKTFQELDVYGLGALTCIVSFDPKNQWGHRFVPVDPQVIKDQIEAAVALHELSTVKIGMLGTPATIDAVAESLTTQPWKNIVLDPVLICKGQEPGAALDTDTALREKILPLATVVTPNHFEAKTLAGMDEINNVDDLIEAAKRIHAQGPSYVIAKGGAELPGEFAVDVLYDGTEVTIFSEPKVGEERVSGAGCTFAAAITAELAKGSDITTAVAVAKNLVTQGIKDRVESNAPFASIWQRA
ncbi:bifunctional hydroxymethylpyrimidine kinase/phosphomethylpyrimidine kinase [Timonella sp. A28]|uniref:bifunctional hydroxymethylpyrimidine kinase/phosphomethylpyrimidine kinase n=1 Tax=Timonella sp. A28 TaxID=3442640 RepID=UPI003EB9E982